MKFFYVIFLVNNIILLITSIEEEKYEEKIVYFPIELNWRGFYANIYIGEPEVKILLPWIKLCKYYGLILAVISKKIQ
jgi:hypothetical protein